MESIWVVLWAAVSAHFDWRQRRIPNALSLGGAALALVWLLVHGETLLGGSWRDAGLGLLLALVLTVPGYVLGQLGAGDVKMLAAFALMATLADLLETIVVAGLAALLAVVTWRWLVLSGRALDAGKRRHLPMGVFFAAGMVASQAGQAVFGR